MKRDDVTPAKKKIAGRLLRLFVTALLLALVLRVVDVQGFMKALASTDLTLAALALLVAIGDRAVMILKWYPLVRVQSDAVTLLRAARAYLAAGFAYLYLPTGVGPDVLRVMAVGHRRGLVVEIGASVVAERLLGLVASGLLSLLALVLAVRASIDLTFIVPWALGAIGVGVIAIVIPYSRGASEFANSWLSKYRGVRLIKQLERFVSSYSLYRSHGRLLLLLGVLSVFEQLLPVLAMWLLAVALGSSISFGMLVIAVPLTLFAGRLPISIGGLGVTEGSYVYLLGLFGIAPSEALALSVIGRVIGLLAVLPGAALWADLVEPFRRQQDPS